MTLTSERRRWYEAQMASIIRPLLEHPPCDGDLHAFTFRPRDKQPFQCACGKAKLSARITSSSNAPITLSFKTADMERRP